MTNVQTSWTTIVSTSVPTPLVLFSATVMLVSNWMKMGCDVNVSDLYMVYYWTIFKQYWSKSKWYRVSYSSILIVRITMLEALQPCAWCFCVNVQTWMNSCVMHTYVCVNVPYRSQFWVLWTSSAWKWLSWLPTDHIWAKVQPLLRWGLWVWQWLWRLTTDLHQWYLALWGGGTGDTRLCR